VFQVPHYEQGLGGKFCIIGRGIGGEVKINQLLVYFSIHKHLFVFLMRRLGEPFGCNKKNKKYKGLKVNPVILFSQ
jgi:hypothetical protein